MDQGYQQVPRRVASGWFSLGFFIVLCLALIGGYVPLVLNWQEKTQDLNTINDSIDKQLVEPLRAQQVVLKTDQPLEGTTLIYGQEFWKQVSELAIQGTRYEELFRLTGWPTKESLLDDIQGKLDKTGQPHLKRLIETGESDRANLASQVASLNKNLDEARKERDQKANELLTARAGFRTELQVLQDRLKKEQADAIKQIEEYKAKWADANKQRQIIWDEKLKAERVAAGKIAGLEKTVTELDAEIRRLRNELARGKPVVQTGAVGTILKTDLIHKFVIIDRGVRDEMTTGISLLVYRRGHRGEKLPIGKVIVVSVERIVSRADIVEQDDANPIIPGDVLYLRPPRD